MSLNVQEEDGAFASGRAIEFSHELVTRKGDGCGACSGSQQSDPSDTTSTANALNLAQGENWLRLVVSLDRNAALHDIQETTVEVKPFPSISSLSEVGTIDAPTDDCYICIDVDGPHVTIKDMRTPVGASREEDTEDDVFEVCIARRNQGHERGISAIECLADSQASTSMEIVREDRYGRLERLGHRQLRLLHEGDRIVTRNNVLVEGDKEGLVLEYRRHNHSRRAPDSQAHVGTSGETEVSSRPSDGPQTQAEDLTPATSTQEEYTTALEAERTQESDDESSSCSVDGGEEEATQAFPRPLILATQSPEHTNSDDGVSMDVHPPESEKDSICEQETRDIAIDDQPQGSTGSNESAVDADAFSQSTRCMSTPQRSEQASLYDTMTDLSHGGNSERSENVESPFLTPRDLSSDIGAMNSRDPCGQGETARKAILMPIAEDDTRTEEASADEDVSVASQAQDASSKRSQNMEDSAEADDMESKSDSDALLDADDLQATPVKVVDDGRSHTAVDCKQNKADDDVEATGATAMQEQSNDHTPVNKATSDSSSITEVGEAQAGKDVLRSVNKPLQNEERQELPKEPSPSGKGDDASCASSITEVDETSSPLTDLAPFASERLGNSEAGHQHTNDEASTSDAAEDGERKRAETRNLSTGGQATALEAAVNVAEASCSLAHEAKATRQPEAANEVSIAEINKHTSTPIVESTEAKGSSEVETGGGTPRQENAENADDVEHQSGSTYEISSSGDASRSDVTRICEKKGHSQGSDNNLIITMNSYETQVTSNVSPTLKHPVEESRDRREVAQTSESYVCRTSETSPNAGDSEVASAGEMPASDEIDEPTGSSLGPEDERNGIAVDVEKKSCESTVSVGATKSPGEMTVDNGETWKIRASINAPSSHLSTDSTEQKLTRHKEEKDIAPMRTSKKRPRSYQGDLQKPVLEGQKGGRTEEPVQPPAKRSSRRKAPAKQPEVAEEEESTKTPSKKRTRANSITRGSAMKRTRTASTPTSMGEDGIRVVMTGVDTAAKHSKMVASIGGVLLENVEDAHRATHVIAKDAKNPLRRTPKLMIGMCRTSKIIDMNWLIKSAKARKALPCNDFLLLKDKDAEKRYDFVMQEALLRGDELRRKDELLLTGYWIYVCKAVPGNKAPPEKELQLIVDAAGGKWLSSVAPRVTKDLDASKIVIITTEKTEKKTARNAEAKNIESAINMGAQAHPASWLFQCIIRQNLDDW